MEKFDIIRTAFEIIGAGVISFLGHKTFKFKDIIIKLITAAEDGKVTEEEFQEIVDEVKEEIYPKK